ncbi:hypothetical protein GGR57DRAFT_495142 [Xylariaceae sp. FL1272]|nr:hypothetical protein GGR57DRAFT_495142 [Xylariaceae sp. FL1272]
MIWDETANNSYKSSSSRKTRKWLIRNHEVPSSLAPFLKSQYYQLLNLVDTTMEQTSTVITKLQRAASFTNFNKLPPELRIKIWQHAMPDARTVVVKSPFPQQKQTPASLEDALPQTFNEELTWQATTQLPALLHVNAEARHEALKRYTLSLGVGKCQPRIYVDFERDTIFFGNTEIKQECSPLWAETRGLDKVQRLAVVPEGSWRVLRWEKVDLVSLQKMIFVHDTDKVRLGPLSQLVEDDASEVEMSLETELEQQIKTLEATAPEEAGEELTPVRVNPMKMRMESARAELDILMVVLTAQWERGPAITTAVFKKSRGDRWAC